MKHHPDLYLWKRPTVRALARSEGGNFGGEGAERHLRCESARITNSSTFWPARESWFIANTCVQGAGGGGWAAA